MKWSALIAVVLVSACAEGGEGIGRKGSPAWMSTASTEAKVAHFQEVCSAYGYSAGTPQMAQCIQTEVSNASSRAQTHWANMSAQNQAQQRQMQTTNCQRIGTGMVTCNTF